MPYISFNFCKDNPQEDGFLYVVNGNFLFELTDQDLTDYEEAIIFEENLKNCSNPLVVVEITLKRLKREFKDFAGIDMYDLWDLEDMPSRTDLAKDLDKYIIYTGFQCKAEGFNLRGCSMHPHSEWKSALR